MKTAWPHLPFFTRCLRFWRPAPVNLPETVTACVWDYTPKPPFFVVDANEGVLTGAWRAATLDVACRHFATKLIPSFVGIHAVIDARGMIVLAISDENLYSGCAVAWDVLARHFDPIECAILETWAHEGMKAP